MSTECIKKDGDYGRLEGPGATTNLHLLFVLAGSAASRATTNVIRSPKLPTDASRRTHAFLKMVLLPPGLRILEAVAHCERRQHTCLPYLLGCNDLMQINRL